MPPPIRGFIESTLLDWEGRLASVIFLPGCNFRCPFCHARDLVEPLPSDEEIPLEAVLLNLRHQRGWIDGVVICGGEPTIHPDLIDLIEILRAEGVGIKLDTNGSRPQALERLLALGALDYVAMDVKAPLNTRYQRAAGVSVDLDALRRSIGILMASDTPCEFRTTACPTLTNEEDVESIARDIRGARLYVLQTFRPVNCLDRSFENVKPYNPDRMRDLCRLASKHVRRCIVRGDQASEITAPQAQTRR